jgi:hypothetical protein
MRDFRERFALKMAEEERRKLVEEILSDQQSGAVMVGQALDELRHR